MSTASPEVPVRPEGKLFWPLLALSTYVGIGAVVRQSTIHLDDAFIYFRVVQHLLEGLGPVFNPGDGHTALTSPLWTYELALAKLALPGAAYPQLAKALSALNLAVACCFAGLLLRRHAGWTAGFAPLAVAFTPVVIWRAGMGIPLALGTCLGTLWAFDRRRHPALVGTLLGLAYLSRGECVFLGPLMALFLLWEKRASRSEILAGLRYLIWVAGAATVIALVWHVYYYAEFGALVPETLRAKIYQGAGDWPLYSERVWMRIESATRGVGLFAVSVCIGGFWLARRIPILLAWPLVHYLAYSWLGVAYYGWYYYDIEFVITLAGFFGAVVSLRWGAKRIGTALAARGFGEGALRAGATALTVAATVLLFPSFARSRNGYDPKAERPLELASIPRSSFAELDRAQLRGRGKVYWRAAEWLLEHASATTDKCMLVDEIGLMGYLCPEWELRDTVGLATPLHSEDELLDIDLHVERQRPAYVLLLGGSWPARKTFVAQGGAPLHYELAHEVTLGGRRPRAAWYVRERAPARKP